MTIEIGVNTQQAQTQVSQLEKAFQNLESRIETLTQALGRQQLENQKLEAEQKKVQAQLTSATAALQKQQEAYRALEVRSDAATKSLGRQMLENQKLEKANDLLQSRLSTSTSALQHQTQVLGLSQINAAKAQGAVTSLTVANRQLEHSLEATTLAEKKAIAVRELAALAGAKEEATYRKLSAMGALERDFRNRKISDMADLVDSQAGYNKEAMKGAAAAEKLIKVESAGIVQSKLMNRQMQERLKLQLAYNKEVGRGVSIAKIATPASLASANVASLRPATLNKASSLIDTQLLKITKERQVAQEAYNASALKGATAVEKLIGVDTAGAAQSKLIVNQMRDRLKLQDTYNKEVGRGVSTAKIATTLDMASANTMSLRNATLNTSHSLLNKVTEATKLRTTAQAEYKKQAMTGADAAKRLLNIETVGVEQSKAIAAQMQTRFKLQDAYNKEVGRGVTAVKAATSADLASVDLMSLRNARLNTSHSLLRRVTEETKKRTAAQAEYNRQAHTGATAAQRLLGIETIGAERSKLIANQMRDRFKLQDAYNKEVGRGVLAAKSVSAAELAAADISSLRNVSLNKTYSLVDKVTKSTTNLTGANKLLAASKKSLHDAARGLSGALGGLWMTYGALVPMAAGFTAAISVASINKLGSSFEYLTSYSHSISDMSMSVEDMQKSLLGVKELGKGPIELAEGFKELVKAGMSASEAMKEIPVVSKFSTIAEQDLAKATEQLVTMQSAFAKTSKNAAGEMITLADTADIIASATQGSIASFDDFQTALKYTTALANNAELSLQEVSAAAMVFADSGLKGSIGTTAMRTAITRMLDPADKVKGLMEKAGVSFNKFASGDKIMNLEQMFTELNRIREEMSKQEWIEFSISAFGRRGELIMAALSDLEKYRENLDTVATSAGFVENAFRKLTKTTQMQAKFFKDELQGALVKAFDGEKAREILNDLRDIVGDPSFSRDLEAISSGAYAIARSLGSIASQFFRLPPLVAEVGIVGAMLFGLKGKLVLAGLIAAADAIDNINWAIKNGVEITASATAHMDEYRANLDKYGESYAKIAQQILESKDRITALRSQSDAYADPFSTNSASDIDSKLKEEEKKLKYLQEQLRNVEIAKGLNKTPPDVSRSANHSLVAEEELIRRVKAEYYDLEEVRKANLSTAGAEFAESLKGKDLSNFNKLTVNIAQEGLEEMEREIAAATEKYKEAEKAQRAIGERAVKHGALTDAQLKRGLDGLKENYELTLDSIREKYGKVDTAAAVSRQKLSDLTAEMNTFIENSGAKTVAKQLEGIEREHNARARAIKAAEGSEAERAAARLLNDQAYQIKRQEVIDTAEKEILAKEEIFMDQLVNTGNAAYDRKLAKLNKSFAENQKWIGDKVVDPTRATELSTLNEEVYYKQKLDLQKDANAKAVTLENELNTYLAVSRNDILANQLGNLAKEAAKHQQTIDSIIVTEEFSAERKKELASDVADWYAKEQERIKRDAWKTERDQLLSSGNFVDGIKAGLLEVQNSYISFGDVGYTAVKDLSNGVSEALTDMVFHADSSFQEVVESFARMVTQMMIQKALIEPLLNFAFAGFGTSSSTASSAISTGIGAVGNTTVGALSATLNAQGNVYSGPGISEYSNSIVDKPTFFANGGNVMGEAGPEVIMPVTKMPSGNFGVETSGTGVVNNIFINNYSDANVTQKDTPNSSGGLDIEIMIDSITAKNVVRQGSASHRAVRNAAGSQLISR